MKLNWLSAQSHLEIEHWRPTATSEVLLPYYLQLAWWLASVCHAKEYALGFNQTNRRRRNQAATIGFQNRTNTSFHSI
jgi:hypothetical protein